MVLEKQNMVKETTEVAEASIVVNNSSIEDVEKSELEKFLEEEDMRAPIRTSTKFNRRRTKSFASTAPIILWYRYSSTLECKAIQFS